MTQVYQLPNYIKALKTAGVSSTLFNVCMNAELYDIVGEQGRTVLFRSIDLPDVEYVEFRFTRERVGVIRFDEYFVKE